MGLLLLASALPASPRLVAAPAKSGPARESVTRSSRSQLVLRVDGALSADSERVLVGLIASERAGSRVTLVLQREARPVAAWLRAALEDQRALLIAILDVSATDEWQLTVVDAARGRALVRHLPGGLASNAASLEAVASILNSAVAALEEGLEVASQPVEQVLAGAAPPAEPARSRTPVRPPPPAELAAPVARAPARIRVRGGVAAAVASIAESASATGGLSASLGLQASSGVGLRVSGTAYFPARFQTELGDFELSRSLLGLGLGFSLRLPPFSLEPELGATAELLRRSGASPVPGVFVRADNAYARLGPFGALRLRYPLFSLASLELTGTVAYYPRRIRFAARSAETHDLGGPSPFSVGAQLGVEIMSL